MRSPHAMNSLYIFKFCFSMYFNSSWTEMSFIDMITNSLLEIWNLVWTKRQKRGKPPRRICHSRYCTWAQQCSHFPFSFGFFHQTLNHYFSYIGSKEKKLRKIWPLKVYSNLKSLCHSLPKCMLKGYQH